MNSIKNPNMLNGRGFSYTHAQWTIIFPELHFYLKQSPRNVIIYCFEVVATQQALPLFRLSQVLLAIGFHYSLYSLSRLEDNLQQKFLTHFMWPLIILRLRVSLKPESCISSTAIMDLMNCTTHPSTSLREHLLSSHSSTMYRKYILYDMISSDTSVWKATRKLFDICHILSRSTDYQATSLQYWDPRNTSYMKFQFYTCTSWL